MKLRHFLFVGTVLLALTATFGFKTTKKKGDLALGGPCYYTFNGICDRGVTDQSGCLPTIVGPVCTVTLGTIRYNAYLEDVNQSCVYPIYYR